MYRIVTVCGKSFEVSSETFNFMYSILKHVSDEVVKMDVDHEIFMKEDKAIAELLIRGGITELKIKTEEAVKLLVEKISRLYELIKQIACRDCKIE